MNRRLVSRLASLHFAATHQNRETLLREGIPEETTFVTGNPVIDALEAILARSACGVAVEQALASTAGLKRIVLTTHRRESFGRYMTQSLTILRRFVEANDDVALLFPVHPNPVVVATTNAVLGSHPRIQLLAPLNYQDFVQLLSRAWLIVSDSGGVQEEAPSLGRPLIILRENTERPEAVECGIARLVGHCPDRLAVMLGEARQQDSWVYQAARVPNPFGNGNAGARIVDVISRYLLETNPALAPVQSMGVRR